ncbi:MAG: GNAT family N-acetyltransferase [Caldilineaceae bacterium]
MGDNVSVHMISDPIGAFPVIDLPMGYSFRAYRTGDEATWNFVQRGAERFFEIEDTLFRREFGHDEAILAQRMAFVVAPNGDAAATITAWWQDDWRGRGRWGQIHWVAVHPAHQRRGLSKPMMTWAMQQLAASYPRAMLGTSTGRAWAIKVYLDFGFVPDPVEMEKPEIVDAWRILQEKIRHPVLEGVTGNRR